MLSWLRRALQNRRLVVRSGVAAGAVAVAGIGFFAWLPALARARIANQLQTRTGLSAAVSGVSLGLLSVHVDSIALGAATAGPRVELSGLALDAGVFSLALRGTHAIDAVEIERVGVRMPLQAQETRALLERVLARKSATTAEPASQEARALPALRIAKLDVAVDDEHGALLRIAGAVAHSDSSSAGVTASSVRVGGAPSAELVLTKLDAQLERSPQGMVLSGLSIGDARMWPGEPSAAQAPPTPATDDDADDEGPVDDGLKPAKNDRGAPKAPVVAVAAPLLRPSLLKRIRAAIPERAPASTTASAPAPAQPHRSLLDRLAQGAQIKLGSGAVFASRNTPAVLEGLRVQATVRGDGALAFSGNGNAKGGGTLSWDLTARPELVQADGSVKLHALPLDLVAPYLPAVPWYEPERGRIDAELVVKTEPAKGIAFSGEVALRDAALSSPRIAAIPVHDIEVALHGSGRFLPLQDRLEIDDAELRLHGASASVHGAVEWNHDHYLFDFDANMPLTPCTDAVRSIPEDLLGDMALASWRGKIGGKLHVKLDSRDLEKGELEIDPEDHCEFVAVPAMADLRRFQFPFTHTVLEPDGTEFEMETGPGTTEWTYIEDISPFFVHAVLAHEDAGFFTHHGFSEMHIRSALIRNLQEGRYVVGASTITMQLVKNVFLHREKTLARKIQEVLLTWWIERVMPKRDILELYLNVIEYGPAIYGIRHAARHYFNRLPGQLSPAESVFFATILPNPKRYHAYFERGALTPSWTEQMRKMLVRLRERGSYSPEAYEYGLSELQNFKFVPEGTVVEARTIPGETAPLPYMQGYQEGEEPGWDDPDQQWDAADGKKNPPGGSTAFTSGPAVGHPPAHPATNGAAPTAVPAGHAPPAGTRPGVSPRPGAPTTPRAPIAPQLPAQHRAAPAR